MNALRQHRRIAFLAVAVVVSLFLVHLLSSSSTVHDFASKTQTWSKEYAAKLASPLYDHPPEIQVPLAPSDNKDPCVDVPLPDGGLKPKISKNTLVLVTGGGGFIGSNLVDKLLDLGYRVRVMDNLYTGFIRNVPLHKKNVEFVYGDIMNPEVLKEAVKDVEYIFHLAAMSKVLPSMKDPEMAKFCVENNAIGSWNVLNATRERKTVKKVIYAGSSTYYGNQPIPHQEDMAPDFLTPYAASKYEGEVQMQLFDRIFDVPTIINRFFMVYGPRQPTTGAYAIVTGVFANQAAHDKPLTIEGDGSHFRDFIHVQDIIKGLILSQQTQGLRGGTPINLGSGTYFSVKDVADMVSETQTHVPERKNDLVGTLADTCRMKRVLNYKTSMDFRKEMAFMAKETIKGNVFSQEWVTPLHALSVPHMLPAGSPVIPWPETGILDDVLNAFAIFDNGAQAQKQAVTEEQQQTISIIPFHGDKVELENKSLLLSNTLYSLVRFGQARRYVIVADGDYFKACQEWNLPCVKPKSSEEPLPVAELLESHKRVHISQVGTTYIKPIVDLFQATSDITVAQPRGDIFIRATPATQSAASQGAKMAKDAKGTDALGRFLSEARQSKGAFAHATNAALKTESLCPSEANKWQRNSCPDTPLVTLSCGDSSKEPSVEESIEALKATPLWLLSECTNGKYCDKQQSIPLRWIAKTSDLSTEGPWC